MKNWIDFDTAQVFAIPLTDPVDGARVFEGMLIEGPQGWGEFSPPWECDDRMAARWLTAAIEAGTVGWPDPVRGRVPVAVTVPAVDPARAHRIVADSGCSAAAVRVAGRPASLSDDLARLEAVRDALGPAGVVRADAGGSWHAEQATAAIPALDRAAGGLEFIVRPCREVDQVRSVRARVDVPLALDPEFSDSADIIVLGVGPLGGVRRALRVAEACGLPCVVTAGLQSSVGVSGGLALAGALPEAWFAAELGAATLLTGDLVSPARSLRPVDGRLPVAPMPPAPDPRLIARFAAVESGGESGGESGTVRRWRDRLQAAVRQL